MGGPNEAAAAAWSSPAPLHRLIGGGARESRWKLALGAIGLLLVNLAVGVVARQQHRATLDYAINIYDTAITASNYLHKSQLSFQQFADTRPRAASDDELAQADAFLDRALDELEVAIERSDTPATRAQATDMRTKMTSLSGARLSTDELTARVQDIQDGLSALGGHAASVLLRARDDIDEFSARTDMLLIGSIASSILLAAIALLLLRHTINKSTVARITHMATYDALTGLPNRNLLHTRLSGAIDARQQGGSFAVLSLDLDRFKQVNDTLGHHTGDLLLIEVSRRLRGLLRDSDTVARFGGDEFVVLQAPVREPQDAGELAERIVATVGAPYEIDGQRIVIGASVGIAIVDADGADPEELLRNSDVALYRAKACGKGRFCFFTADMNTAMQSRRTLELELRDALDRESLSVYFQPLVDVASGAIVSCEALVRWTHPVRGPISPADFIPLAEETGLVSRIGEFVLRTACMTAASWPAKIGVAVNLSTVQFRSDELVDKVAAILSETGLEPTRLELEITESILIEDKEKVMGILQRLHALGVRIALDDFGTGYSSLAYLSSFPFDKIKIDRSFVRDLAERPDSAAIVRAILSLAQTLSMSVTAEGVEKADELEWLRSQGCKQAQGYLFSAALPPRQFVELLRAFRAREQEGAPLIAHAA